MAMGKEIRKLRLAKGWTLEKLEEESGVAVGTISALENRDSSRSIYFPVLARALGVTYEQLSGGEYMPDEWVTPSGALFVAESKPTPDHLAGVHVGQRLLNTAVPPELSEKYAAILLDLEDIPPGPRARILQEIRGAAKQAREAAAHFASRKRPFEGTPTVEGEEPTEEDQRITARLTVDTTGGTRNRKRKLPG